MSALGAGGQGSGARIGGGSGARGFEPDGLVHADARIVDGATGDVLAGSALRARIERIAEAMAALPPGVVFARTGIDVDGVLRYLGAITAGRAVALLDPAVDSAALGELVRRFRPAAIVGVRPGGVRNGNGGNGSTSGGSDGWIDGVDVGVGGGYRGADVGGAAWVRADADGVTPHPELAVLLATSGSTGNPKLVRLSRAAVLANARSIADALRLDAAEVAPTSLPLHYSYGLSVLNSHLITGATVLVEGSGVLGRGFWRAVTEHRATSLAGVPYHYELLRRLRFDPARYPTLRTLTQAGGRLHPERITEFAGKMHAVDGRLYVMYGQTEACARMAVLPAERITDKLGSAGRAIPGGEFRIRTADGDTGEPGVSGEVLYRGPNVMMGYAETEAELATGDEHGGLLATGDLGHLDADGFLFLTGRAKRIGKIFGNRVNLDDVERLLTEHTAAAVAGPDQVIVHLERADADSCRAATKFLADRLHLHPTGFDVRGIDALPLLANGKVDYRALEES